MTRGIGEKTSLLVLALILVSIAASVWTYPSMPESVASHWNIEGVADGYMPRFAGLFFMPIMIIIVAALLYLLPRFDPLSENLNDFRKEYNLFVLGTVAFLTYIHVLTLLWNMGMRFDMTFAIMPGISLLFYLIGFLLPKTKRNWFIGIRTPWTLSSDAVWEKTHRLGGTIFKIAALIGLGGLLFPRYGFYLIILPAILFSVALVVYSYLLFRREAKTDRNKK
jgi:uncharacterized membrane protein